MVTGTPLLFHSGKLVKAGAGGVTLPLAALNSILGYDILKRTFRNDAALFGSTFDFSTHSPPPLPLYLLLLLKFLQVILLSAGIIVRTGLNYSRAESGGAKDYGFRTGGGRYTDQHVALKSRNRN